MGESLFTQLQVITHQGTVNKGCCNLTTDQCYNFSGEASLEAIDVREKKIDI